MRQIAVTRRFVCTDPTTSRCDKTLVQCTESILEEEMWTGSNLTWRQTNWCFLIGWFKFCCSDLSMMRTHGATRLLALILSLWSVARIQTSLNSCDRSQWQTSVTLGMIFTSHKAICCGNLWRRRVAAICCIVCLGLKAEIKSVFSGL